MSLLLNRVWKKAPINAWSRGRGWWKMNAVTLSFFFLILWRDYKRKNTVTESFSWIRGGADERKNAVPEYFFWFHGGVAERKDTVTHLYRFYSDTSLIFRGRGCWEKYYSDTSFFYYVAGVGERKDTVPKPLSAAAVTLTHFFTVTHLFLISWQGLVREKTQCQSLFLPLPLHCRADWLLSELSWPQTMNSACAQRKHTFWSSARP